jgi:8-oxo-dGTP diphosphatase
MEEHEQGVRLPVAVDVVIFSVRGEELVALLVRRAAEPFARGWALPGGFLRPGEALDAAARRELQEQTGVADVYLEQLYTFGEPARDPRERVLSVSYFALLPFERARLSASAHAAEAAWHPVADLPALAFDHAAILEYARLRLRWKLEYTNAVYSLLPERFSLSEIQRVYEIILQKPLDKRNFRKWLRGTGLVEATGQVRRSGAHRPAQLFRFQAREIRML